MKVRDLRYESHGLMTRKPGTYDMKVRDFFDCKSHVSDLSYYVVKILILFAEIQEKQVNISIFNVKI